MRRGAFLCLGAAEAQHLERERGIECWPGHAQPVVERIFGPPQRRLGAARELARDLQRFFLQLAFLARQRDEPEALGLLAADRLAKEEVILRLGHAAEKRPDDRRVIAGRYAEPRVTVDEPRV